MNPDQYTDWALLLLRALTTFIFIESGRRDLKDPEGRSQSIGMSRGFTIFLGAAEIAGGVGLLAGIFIRWAALGLMLVMAAAVVKKAFAWDETFWGKKGTGWHYDLLLLLINLVILTTAGGKFVLLQG